MAVSVRMDPLLESKLAQAAKRRGITKSQCIVEAVELALGRNSPGELHLKVMQEMASYTMAVPADLPLEALPATQAALQQSLHAKQAAERADYAAFLEAQAPTAGGAA